jgi:hypothetical protein
MFSNLKIVGRCSLCGGVVSVPFVSWSVGRVLPTCEECGATLDETANRPTLPMRRRATAGDARKCGRG